MRFALLVLLMPVFACTRTEAPAPVPATAPAPGVELTAIATPALDDDASCGNGAACGEEKAEKQAGSCGAHAESDHASTAQSAFDAVPAHGETALCLVMNREFVVDDRTATSVYEGKTYAFCCDGCKQAFDENPAKYVHADAAQPEAKSKS